MHKKTHKTKRMKKIEALLQEYQTLFVTLPRSKPLVAKKAVRQEMGQQWDMSPPIDETAGNTFINIQNKQTIIMATKDTVLETMRQAGTPLAAGKIAELSGLDRKEVDKAMKELKAEGAIVSPVRCKWEPAQK